MNADEQHLHKKDFSFDATPIPFASSTIRPSANLRLLFSSVAVFNWQQITFPPLDRVGLELLTETRDESLGEISFERTNVDLSF